MDMDRIKENIGFIVLGTAGVVGVLIALKEYNKRKGRRMAGIEAGGTSFVIGIADGSPENIIEKHQIFTKDPETTLNEIASWLNEREYSSLGIASFGPLNLDPESEGYGSITSTPKRQWTNFPLLKSLSSKLNFKGRIGFETDVNGSVLAEFTLGNHPVRHSLCYVTIGTGVGIALLTSDHILKGLTHTEGGHMLLQRHPQDMLSGICPFHGDCLEGLVTNHALAKRFDCSIHDLDKVPDDASDWEFIAHYLAVMCYNITILYTPEAIVLGGGIMNRAVLLPKIRVKFVEILNGYIQHPGLNPDRYIRKATLEQSGLVGAILLGQKV